MKKFKENWISSILKLKILTIYTLLLGFISLKAQNFNCLTNSGSSPFPSGALTLCPLSSISDVTRANLPDIHIKINIHFIKGGNCGNGNFEPLNNGAWNDGYAYANSMMNDANSLLNNFVTDPLGGSFVTGDIKIQYDLVPGPNSPSGVYFWDNLPSSFPNGNNVINIVMLPGSANERLNGYVTCVNLNCNVVTLYGAWYNECTAHNDPNYNKFGFWAFSRLFGHEFFHILGLCHTFYAGNPCSDIDPSKEIGSGGTPTNDCGTGATSGDPWNSGSRNIMGYNANSDAITKCQWATVYGNLLSVQPNWASICDQDPGDIVIQSGANEIWNDFRIIRKPVHVMPGATLTITCEIQFQTNMYIEVQRGAQLNIDGGFLTSLCKNSSWKGIQVWGNPNVAQPNPANNPGINEAGIVRLTNGAKISYANTAISTGAWALGGSAAWANAGGLIYAQNAFFVNNKRAVEFMSYKFNNKSLFNHCQFTEPGNVFANSVGVTVWDCNGITFTNNIFRYLDKAGIYGIDFGAEIFEHNQFTNLPVGIESYNTLYWRGALNIGTDGSTPNYFKNNVVHVFCSSTSGLDKTNIVNNDFFDGTNGVVIEGLSTYRVEGNRFQNLPVACVSDDTGEDANWIKCNSFENAANCIQYHALNNQSQFLDNCMNPNTDIGVVLSDAAVIRDEQGSSGRHPGNCLQSLTDIFTPSSGNAFTYYCRPTAITIPHCSSTDPNCQKPTNNLSDGGNNDYFIASTSSPIQSCNTGGGEGINTPLVNARINEENAKQSWLANPTNTSLKTAYQEATAITTSVIRQDLKPLILQENYTAAMNLLIPTNSKFEYFTLYNLKLLAGDYIGAQSMINALPSVTNEDNWLKQLQTLNISRLQNVGTFTLASTDESLLRQIAQSNSYLKAQAKALLAYILGESSVNQYSAVSDPLNPRIAANSHEKSGKIEISPNPSNGSFTINYPSKYQNDTYLIIDLLGKLIAKGELSSNGKLEIKSEELSEGVYILNVTNNKGEILESTNFVIQK